MRTHINLFSAVALTVLLAGQAWALDTDTFSIKQSGNSHTAPVAFTIAYPKGWCHLSGFGSQSKFSDFTTIDGDNICMFWPTNTSITSFAFWRTDGPTAAASAGAFSASLRQRGVARQCLTSVRTTGGDLGCLVESESTVELGYGVGPVLEDGAKTGSTSRTFSRQPLSAPMVQQRIISHDYFFHSGAKGCVRITIETPVTDSAQLAELDQIVLKTLQFEPAPPPPADTSRPVATK